MADLDYPAVLDDEELDQQKKARYPAPEPSGAVAPPLVDTTPPAPEAKSYLGQTPESRLSLIRPAPRQADYAVPAPHGLAKLGHLAASFNPETNQMFNTGPTARAATAYEAASKEHDTDFKNQLDIEKETREGAKEKSEAELKHAQAGAYDKTPVVINGQTFYVPQKDAERLIGEKVKAEAGQKKEETRGETARDVAALKVKGAREPIRVMGDRTFERTPDGTWKDIGPAPVRAEAGNYSPVNDENGATVGWVNPKNPTHMVHVSEIPGLDEATGGQGAIPPKPSGQTRSRQDQAAAIDRASTGLIATITQHRDKIGNVEAILKSAFLNTPLADKELSGVATELASYAALQPALHGFRGQDALREFIKIIGGIPKDADALAASIKAIQKTAGYVNPRIAKNAPPAEGKPPEGASDEVLQDGKVIGHVVKDANGKKKFVPLAKVQ